MSSQPSPSSQPTPTRVLDEAGDGEVWWDSQTPSDSWNAPTWWDALTARTKVLGVLATVVVVTVVIWATGGLKAGGVRFSTVAQGQPIVSGPFELTFTQAKWEYSEYANDNQGGYRLTINATCRNIDATSYRNLGLSLADSLLIGGYKDGTLSLAADTVVWFGAWGNDKGLRREELAPGLPAMPCTITGVMKAGFQPQAWAVVGVYDLFWNDSDDVQAGGQRWHHRETGVRTQVPAVVVSQ